MSDPITLSSILWGATIFIGQSVASGIIGNQSYDLTKKTWEALQDSLKQWRPGENHELLRALYCSYLQATLQVCAQRGRNLQMPVDKWIFLESIITKPVKHFMSEPALGFQAEAERQWIDRLKSDLITKLNSLSKIEIDILIDNSSAGFAELVQQSDLLMQIDDANQRKANIRTVLNQRVLNDLGRTWGPLPTTFKNLFEQYWFDYLCACFQHQIKKDPELANLFQSKLLAGLVQANVRLDSDISLSQIQDQLNRLSGGLEKGLEQISQLLEGQQIQLDREEQNILLPLLSTEHDTNVRVKALQEIIQAGFQQTEEYLGRIEGIVDRLQLTQIQPLDSTPEPIIHNLPLSEVQGREKECEILLQAMCERNDARILAFMAPGGFGKTALLTKLIKEKLSDKGRILEPTIQAILHIDCRREVKMLDIFTKAGRLVGREQIFRELYADAQTTLQEKLFLSFKWLAVDIGKTVWIVFDNFETTLNEDGRFAQEDLQQFFEACLIGEHNLRLLIASRVLPKISPRLYPQLLVLDEISKLLFDGLPSDDCITYLRKNGATRGLIGNDEEIDMMLLSFAKRVHHIPMALVWAVGYMSDRQGMTLADLMREDFFSDFDEYQYTNSPHYLDKGLKRLHYEQLAIQPPDALLVLYLLAFFNRPVPRAALEHLLPLPKLLKTLTQLSHNKLIGCRDAEDKRTRFVGNDSMTPLYTLHPVICENIFFEQLSDNVPIEILPINENTAAMCHDLAINAYEQNNLNHAMRLLELSEAVCHHLITKHDFHEGRIHLANILGNKGTILSRLNRFSEALQAFDESLSNYQIIQEVGQLGEMANNMAATLMNKGGDLRVLGRLDEAFDFHISAVDIRRKLVKQGNVDMESDLAWALINQAVLLDNLSRFSDAVAVYDEAILLLRKLIKRGLKQHKELLALALVDKGVSLAALDQSDEATESYDEAINIFRYLKRCGKLKEERYFALALKNKGDRVRGLGQTNEALQLYGESISILEESLKSGLTENAGDLANTCVTKARLLKESGSWEEVIVLCSRAIELWFDEVAGKQMIRCMASILESSRLRLMALIQLNRWEEVGADIAIFLIEITQSEEIDLAGDILQEINETRSTLRALPKVQLGHLYANIDALANVLQHFIEDEDQARLLS